MLVIVIYYRNLTGTILRNSGTVHSSVLDVGSQQMSMWWEQCRQQMSALVGLRVVRKQLVAVWCMLRGCRRILGLFSFCRREKTLSTKLGGSQTGVRVMKIKVRMQDLRL